MSAPMKISPTLSVREVADLTGFSRFHVAKLARKGDIPGARQLMDGGKWTFDRERVLAWIRNAEKRTCRELRTGKLPPISSYAEGSGMAALKLMGTNIDKAFEQARKKKPSGASKRGKGASKTSCAPRSRLGRR